MYSLVSDSKGGKQSRLIAPTLMTPQDFTALAQQLRTIPLRARKVGFISARKATATQVITTRWNGEETINSAAPGDQIAANLAPDKSILRDGDGHPNLYVITAAKFGTLYEQIAGESEYGPIYRARGEVLALYLPGGFEILAPWGETQRADCGYLLKNGTEIYGNAKATFEATYAKS